MPGATRCCEDGAMTTTANEMDKLLTFLCHGETQKLANLKFFRGDRDLISPGRALSARRTLPWSRSV